MTEITSPKRQRRMARKPQSELPGRATAKPRSLTKAPSKLDRLEKLLRREGGASIAEMIGATGWLQHSVRGAMAGALKKRGLTLASQKVDGTRRYHAERLA